MTQKGSSGGSGASSTATTAVRTPPPPAKQAPKPKEGLSPTALLLAVIAAGGAGLWVGAHHFAPPAPEQSLHNDCTDPTSTHTDVGKKTVTYDGCK